MTYFGQFPDDPYYQTDEDEAEQSGEAWAQKQQEEAEEQWLADRAAQAEYASWLDTLNSQDEKLWAGTRKTPEAETSNKLQQERTSQDASD